MGFLDKIKNIIPKKGKKESFEEQVRREKKQKYLFDGDADHIFVSKRKASKWWFRGKQKKSTQKGEPFSTFFQRAIDKIGGEQDTKHILGAIGAVLLILSGYIIVFSPYFKISPNRILVEPQSQGVDMSIAYRSLESIYGTNIFMLEEKAIALKLKESLKNIESIRIDRLFPNGVKVLIKSLPIPFESTIYGVENKKFGLSTNGVLIPASDLRDAEFTHHIEVISQELKSEIFLGYKKIISDRNMFFVSKILELFQIEWSDLKIAKARYFSLENELHIVLESNTKILFSLQDETNVPAMNEWNRIPDFLLKELLTFRTYLSNNHAAIIDGSIEYIDARIPGKIFVCPNSDQCKWNMNSVYGNTYE